MRLHASRPETRRWQFAVAGRQIVLILVAFGGNAINPGVAYETAAAYAQSVIWVQACTAIAVLLLALTIHARAQPFCYRFQVRGARHTLTRPQTVLDGPANDPDGPWWPLCLRALAAGCHTHLTCASPCPRRRTGWRAACL